MAIDVLNMVGSKCGLCLLSLLFLAQHSLALIVNGTIRSKEVSKSCYFSKDNFLAVFGRARNRAGRKSNMSFIVGHYNPIWRNCLPVGQRH